MKLTVNQILHTEGFEKFRVICGNRGLNREVSSVSVIDAPDIYNWLQGGEILLTSGYIFKDNTEYLLELIGKIAKNGAAALFIKLGRFIDDMPDEVRIKADELSFPIVYMPFSFSFVDVITPVLTKANSRQLEIIKKSEKIHCIFTNIAIRQEGIGKVLEYLSDLIGQEVAFVDNIKQRVFYSNDEMEINMENYMSKYPCFPITVTRKTYGYLVVNETKYKANEYDLIAIEHASTIIKLEIQREISNDEIERKYRDNLVLDIIYNNINNQDELRERGKLFGWSFEGHVRAMIADVDHFKKNFEKKEGTGTNRAAVNELSRQLLRKVAAEVRMSFKKTIYTTFTDRVVFLLWDEGKSHKEIQKQLAGINERIYTKEGFTLSFAIGGLADEIGMAYRSFREAKTALVMGRRLGWENTSYFYNQLGFYRLLDQLKGNPAVKNFFQDKLGRVEQFDLENHGELFDTLNMLVECNWNLREASEQLYIHYNTMKNRYHKIQEVMGVSLDNMEERLEVEFAIKSKIVNDI